MFERLAAILVLVAFGVAAAAWVEAERGSAGADPVGGVFPTAPRDADEEEDEEARGGGSGKGDEPREDPARKRGKRGRD